MLFAGASLIRDSGEVRKPIRTRMKVAGCAQLGCLVCITSSWPSSSSGTKPLPPHVGHRCSSSVPFPTTPSPLQSGQVFMCASRRGYHSPALKSQALAPSGGCCACRFLRSRADRLGGKIQRSSTQALSIAFAARCRFEDAFGQRGLLHRGLQLRRKAGPSVVKSLPQKGDGFRIKIHSFSADHLSPHVQFRLARNLLVNVTTVWQSDGHCLTFCFQRFEFTACSSRSIELHVMSALLPKADMRSAPTHVRFGPIADKDGRPM